MRPCPEVGIIICTLTCMSPNVGEWGIGIKLASIRTAFSAFAYSPPHGAGVVEDPSMPFSPWLASTIIQSGNSLFGDHFLARPFKLTLHDEYKDMLSSLSFFL